MAQTTVTSVRARLNRADRITISGEAERVVTAAQSTVHEACVQRGGGRRGGVAVSVAQACKREMSAVWMNRSWMLASSARRLFFTASFSSITFTWSKNWSTDSRRLASARRAAV